MFGVGMGCMLWSVWKSEGNYGVAGSLLSPRVSQRLNLGWWAWQQVPLPTELSLALRSMRPLYHLLNFKFNSKRENRIQ